jgi:hypothetical protein
VNIDLFLITKRHHGRVGLAWIVGDCWPQPRGQLATEEMRLVQEFYARMITPTDTL